MFIAIFSFFICLITFFAIDAVWLFIMGKLFYMPYIGHLMSNAPLIYPAVCFYLLYCAGLVVFVVLPYVHTSSYGNCFLYGAFFGLVAYGTYDLTNQATLRDWSLIVTLVDLGWGSMLSGVTVVITQYLAKMISKFW